MGLFGQKIKKSNVAILDIGESKIICASASLNSIGDIFINGFATQNLLLNDITFDKIKDKKKIKYNLIRVVEDTEKLSNTKIKEIYVNINSATTKSFIVTVKIKDNNIKKEQLSKEISNFGETFKQKENRIIIHTIPFKYVCDGVEVDDPFSEKKIINNLEVTFIFITVSNLYLETIKEYLKIMCINIKSCVTNGCSVSSLLLNEEEQRRGGLVINIGFNKTNISVMYKERLIFESCIELGGQHINEEISKVLGVSNNLAEDIKLLNHHLILDDKYNSEFIKVQIDSVDNYKIGTTKIGLISNVVKQKIENIIGAVMEEIQRNGLLKIINNIVLTGGSSLINNIENVIYEYTKIHTRIGVVENFNLRSNDVNVENIGQPLYYSSIGMLKIISQKIKSTQKN